VKYGFNEIWGFGNRFFGKRRFFGLTKRGFLKILKGGVALLCLKEKKGVFRDKRGGQWGLVLREHWLYL